MKQKIETDVKQAMKDGNRLKVDTLRLLLSEIKSVEIDSRASVSDDTILSLLAKEIKKRRDAIDFAKKASRDDLIAQNEKEIGILQEYLGKQLSEDELRVEITKLVAEGCDNLGKIMGALNRTHKGQFEGRVASEIAKSLLAGQQS